MAGLVVLGAQWGDEGKGRIVDYLAQRADMVIRYQGGNNAGHTIELGDKQYKLHLVPSGVLYNDKICLIGNGVVVDPQSLLDEMDGLKAEGISTHNVFVSDRSQVVLPYHRYLDKLSESSLSENEAIGTTGRGIGPAYMDKVERSGIRMCDFVNPDVFPELLKKALERKNKIIENIYHAEPIDYDQVLAEYQGYAQRLKKHVADTSLMAYEYYRAGKNLLFEGAQGTLLDIDHGTYPFVTSSNPVSGGACVGAGLGPNMIDEVLGVAKAYTTRVGNGPFVTELLDDMGQAIREKGHEYGATTGRPRRCGWLDAVILRFAVRVNGITSLGVTRVDTLGGFEKVKLCVGYRMGKRLLADFPASLHDLAKCKPVYEQFDGWDDDISHIRRYEDLPKEARLYLERIESLCETPISMIGVGPKREQCVIRTVGQMPTCRWLENKKRI